MSARWCVVVALAAVLNASCSFFIRSPRVTDRELDCTTSKAVPNVDLGASLVLTASAVVVSGELLGWSAPKGDLSGLAYIILIPLFVPGAVSLGAASNGYGKVNACRREHANRDFVAASEEAERREVADRAERLLAVPFFCTLAPDQRDVGSCSRTQDGCVAHQLDLLDRGVLVEPCVARDRASCFTAVRVSDTASVELCFPTRGSCETQRGLKLQGTAYEQVGACTRPPGGDGD